jgi:hypothetical protein
LLPEALRREGRALRSGLRREALSRLKILHRKGRGKTARPVTVLRKMRKGQWKSLNAAKRKIPHRHFVFRIPKILRHYFLYDRKFLSDLGLAAWESLKVFLQEAAA